MGNGQNQMISESVPTVLGVCHLFAQNKNMFQGFLAWGPCKEVQSGCELGWEKYHIFIFTNLYLKSGISFHDECKQ